MRCASNYSNDVSTVLHFLVSVLLTCRADVCLCCCCPNALAQQASKRQAAKHILGSEDAVDSLPSWAICSCAGGSSAAAAAITNPVDVVKIRLQVQENADVVVVPLSPRYSCNNTLNPAADEPVPLMMIPGASASVMTVTKFSAGSASRCCCPLASGSLRTEGPEGHYTADRSGAVDAGAVAGAVCRDTCPHHGHRT